MGSSDGQRLARIGAWLDRWGYLGVIALIIALVLSGLRGSDIFALETGLGFARYMWLVTIIALGVGVGRPFTRYMHDRFRPWVAAGTPGAWHRYKIVAVAPRVVVLVVAMAGLALTVIARSHGIWPWPQ